MLNLTDGLCININFLIPHFHLGSPFHGVGPFSTIEKWPMDKYPIGVNTISRRAGPPPSLLAALWRLPRMLATSPRLGRAHSHVYTYICAYLHVCIHTYIHGMHAYIRAHIHAHMHTYTCMHTYIHTYMACMHACIRVHIHVRTYTRTHTHILYTNIVFLCFIYIYML